MDPNPPSGPPAPEDHVPFQFDQPESTSQPTNDWADLYGMDFFHPNVSFSGPYMTPAETEMPIFGDGPSLSNIKAEPDLEQDSTLVQPDSTIEPIRTRRRTIGDPGTPIPSEAATPSMKRAARACSDPLTPAESLSASSAAIPNRHQSQNQNQISREKNRVAASKCRKKKKQEEKAMEQKKNVLEREQTMLKSTVKQLEEEVLALKTMILQHGTCNFPPIQNYINAAALRLQASAPNGFATAV
ncbi:hypothetical protein PFICI_00331 [Pestalotiopsis fici W106-1]|uniref:BZIP domain-containing protein n=1 Tax=Pestalotiopsis fici (strain W106-1 / CGMCC3.15140) TaxID=1229662 RepID=W3XKC8_PESFW|nr:uncharacterized protein PFICI_00331 [Pestalotiopsis fici W106-1]ETS86503.1 hypothetical protein PFICI_00331 [Pestalotiopsis fici W106-1]